MILFVYDLSFRGMREKWKDNKIFVTIDKHFERYNINLGKVCLKRENLALYTRMFSIEA